MRRGANPAGAVLALGVRSGELLGARSAPVHPGGRQSIREGLSREGALGELPGVWIASESGSALARALGGVIQACGFRVGA